MCKVRVICLILAGAIAPCLIGLPGVRTQSNGLRRITNTNEAGISLNPSISGDGRMIAFESTRDLAGAGGLDHFRAIRANAGVDPAEFFQMGGSRAVAPALSQDGSRIAFASKDNPLGTNADGNSEIFLLDGSKLSQLTNTSPGDVANRVANGNFQPSLSDDGRFIAFSSNRDLCGQNRDGNLEILIYDTLANNLTQLTNSSGIVGSSDAKISGDGATVAYIRDNGETPSSKRDLMAQPRIGPGAPELLAANVESLSMTYGRAISDDGTRVVYSAEIALNTTQVFLFDGRGAATGRQITSLPARTTEVPLHPAISGDGTRIAFAARRSVPGAPTNSDGSVELYVVDLPSTQVSKITNAPASATADVVSSLNDDGSVVVFNFPRVLSGVLSNGELANNSEIYVAATPPRPAFGALTVFNGASFGKEPSLTKAVAPDSIAVATGAALANSTHQAQRLSNGTFPTNVAGTTVTVNGRSAQIFYVSPGQVNFLVPPQTEIGTAEVVVTNSENFPSHGTVSTLRSAPGVFTKAGDGLGPGVILNSDTLQEGPFDPTGGDLRLTIFATGARNASQNSVVVGGRLVDMENVMASPDMPGLDEIHVVVPGDLRGAGPVDLFVQSDGRAGNTVSVTLTGDASRDVLINEVLADPPESIAGDSNHDGVRDSSDDEFIELVNTTTHDIDVSGYQLFSRSSSTTTDTLRHSFAGGTILPACATVVVFGGGRPGSSDPVFGGSLLFKASSGSLALTNGGGTITLRDSASTIITSLNWGGSTGLNGNLNQSLTRSPDIRGNFILHQAAIESGGQSFSPGTQVNGSAFVPCNSFVRIEVTPASGAIDAGAKQQFTARAIDARGDEVSGVLFSWQSSNTAVAAIDPTGLARSSGTGSTDIKASAHGIQSPPATLTVHEVPRVLTRIEVTPRSATIPASGAQQFTAHGIDQFGKEIAGLTFTWESANSNAATVDRVGLATGVAPGQSTIKATSQNVAGDSSLEVTPPTVLINELLADPPNGVDGDANHDGTRDSAQDEFVELVNFTDAAINLSGWTLRTHSTNSSTETVRHTFVGSTQLPAGEALLVFGGGTFLSHDPLFGCAQAVQASSGGLSLTNSGLTIVVRDGSGNLITQFSYGGTTGLNGGSAQSLTRSPDLNGNFVLHTTLPGTRKFSSGLKVNGVPFGNCPGHQATVTISPSSISTDVGQTTSFTAQAFDQFGRAMIGVAITFASDNTNVATIDSVSINPMTGLATATVFAHSPGTAQITAAANDGIATAQSSQSRLTVSGPSLTINDVTLNEGNSATNIFTFTVNLSAPALAGGVTFDISTRDESATTADKDYVARSLARQTIPAGQSTYHFDVAVNGDVTVELNERFLVNVTNVSGASIGVGTGVGTIVNDDSPLLSISDLSANEGDSGTTTFTITISSTLPAPLGGIVFDIATADGTATSAAGDYSHRNLSGQTIPAGQSSYKFDVSVSGDTLVEPNETFSVNLSNVSNAGVVDGSGVVTIQNDDTPGLVISQVYGGGDNSGAALRNDFVEIYNRGNTTVDFSITPYSIQYASVGSNFSSNKTNLTTGTIVPRRYFLLQEAGGITNGAALPTPDATGTINFSSTAGKVALVTGTAVLATATCPGDDGLVPFNASNTAIADFAGFGSSASTSGHCYEGLGPASAPSNTTANFRKAGGCVDTNDNAADFLIAAPNPRNSSSPDGECLPEITINDVTVTEGNTGSANATFTVKLSTSSSQVVTVNYATADGTATAPADYQSTSGLVTFNPGDLTSTITVPVNGDTLDELNETFFIDLSNATNGVIVDDHAQGTITDNDPAPSLSINDVSVVEGDTGTATATFTVTLSNASGRPVTVNYASADGTAVAGSDYQAATGMLTFDPDDISKTLSVLVNGDAAFEPNETFFVDLTMPANATISDARGQGTIINDDPAPPTPTIAIESVNIVEGNSGTSNATFMVTLAPSSGQTVTVAFATADMTATSGSDYQSANGTLTFNPGETSKPVGVSINGDTVVEPDETFLINLNNATGGALIGHSQGSGKIQNDDTPFIVISQIYGGGGNSGATFRNDFIEVFNRGNTTIELAGWSVQYASATGTNWSVTPLCSNGSCLLFPGHYFLVQEDQGAGGDTNLPSPDATGTIPLTTGSGKVAIVSKATPLNGACPADPGILDLAGYGTTASCFEASPAPAPGNLTADVRKGGGCVDDNNNASDFFAHTPTPRNSATPANICNGQTADVSINDVTITEGDDGTVSANFTVSLIAASAATLTVDYATANGTASSPGDYQALPASTLTFNPGEVSKTITVQVNGDTVDEPDETFFVNLSNATNAAILDSQGRGTIIDDDVPPAITIKDVSQNEGNSGSSIFHFVVMLSAPALAGGVTFDIATQDGTASFADNDYVPKSLTAQTIPAGSTTFGFDVTVNGDPLVEPDETFFVHVSNVSGASVLNGQAKGIIQNDDSPTLSIDSVVVTEGDSGTTPATFTVTLSPPSTQTVTVDYVTSSANPATATAGTDYVATNGTLTFNSGETSKTITVPVKGDTANEAICETLFVNLSNSVNAAISNSAGQGTGSITDDDGSKLIITQVYGGGSNSGGAFQNDFVEIFNRGETTVNFATTKYSVQYASAAGSFSTGNTITLTSGSVAPGQFFLIKLAPASPTTGAALPAADAINTGINLSATDGKVALVLGIAVAATTNGCPTGVTVADLVAYGSANCAETTATAALSATKSAKRSVSCKDTNNNSTDFTVVSNPTAPRNTASTLSPCGCGTSYSSMFIFGTYSWKIALTGPLSSGLISQTPCALFAFQLDPP